MPHQCVRCNTFYEDGAQEILHGCSKCQSRLFFFIRKEKIEQAKELTESLSPDEKVQIEQDVMDLIGQDTSTDEPVVLDLEAIRIVKPGKYELDLVHLFKQDPLIYKVDEGKYIVDLIQTFRRLGEKKNQP